jgi:TolB-like protein
MPGGSPKRQRGPTLRAGDRGPLSAESIRSQLADIIASQEFAKSERLCRFLRFTVERTLAGEAIQLKQYVLARDVFDRKESYDPRIDSIVRVEARRLRTKLQRYYETHNDARVLIEFSQGSYVPVFRERIPAISTPPGPSSSTSIIAVLPFASLGPDADTDFLADGITEAILNELATVPELRVVARTSVYHFKGKTGDVREIGGKLGAGTIVEGSVRKSGDQLRVSAMAVKTADGCSLWSSTFDRPIADVFAIEDEIASAVAQSLRVRLGPPPVRGAENLEAYKLYLRGCQNWTRATREGFEAAVADFGRAVSLSPEYAPPYAGLADAYTWLWILGLGPASDVVPKSRHAVLEALRLDPLLADAYTLLGVLNCWHDWKVDEGTRLLRKALELEPSSIKAISFCGLELVNRGRFSDATVFLEKSLQLDPMSVRTHWALGLACYLQRQYDRAIEWVKMGLELGEGCGSRRLLGYAYLRKHRCDEAVEEMKRSLAEPPLAYGLAGLGEAYGVCGKKREARDILDQLDTLSTTEYVPAISRVRVYAGLGDWEHAFDWLRRAFQEHNIGLAAPGIDPRYDPVRSNPRLKSLLARVGLA